MRYGIFDQESGNLIDTLKDERDALAFVAEMAENDPRTLDVVNVLVVNRRGKTVAVWDGEGLRARLANGRSVGHPAVSV